MRPSIGRIVIYTGQDGVDSPAIITGVVGDGDGVWLQVFPAPGAVPDPQDPVDGVPSLKSLRPRTLGSWRWPERVE